MASKLIAKRVGSRPTHLIIHRTLSFELVMRKTTKKLTINDTNTPQYVDDKNTKNKDKPRLMWKKTTLLEKKTHIWGRKQWNE